VRTWLAALSGIALIGGARLIHAPDERPSRDAPWAPTPSSAPYATLGYREAAADWFWIRLRAYVGRMFDPVTKQNILDAASARALVDAVIALDPSFEPAYEFAPASIDWVAGGPSKDDLLWAAKVCEDGAARFPDRWKLPKLAGELYLLDLPPKTTDTAEKAAYTEKGTTLLERAIRLPDAPRGLATLVAFERTQLGQRDRAIEGLRELISTTDDPGTRQHLIDKLEEISGGDTERIGDEEEWAKESFDRRWHRALPEAPAEIYILVGDPPKPYIDLGDLAAPPDRDADERAAMAAAIGD
jgi:hypothetical protein